ncbi:predicted protein [Plenodomus lingam JN3]|uniref:Predicted protein n=1 Tax=Leptosphaeria maculans (strain JN3 / isolate v23.1.3 / race Av1-4-5-6-7-8) TaxID=985895 RepID=E4ZNL7_LEPMJ|nr:predicted protein [Plenodomus lingam JN3]CBX93076.1 predicted protein [Plenodomus lingam JN3]
MPRMTSDREAASKMLRFVGRCIVNQIIITSAEIGISNSVPKYERRKQLAPSCAVKANIRHDPLWSDKVPNSKRADSTAYRPNNFSAPLNPPLQDIDQASSWQVSQFVPSPFDHSRRERKTRVTESGT